MVKGMTGVMFEQLGWMVTIIMTVSMAASLTLTPMMSSLMLRPDRKRNKFSKWLFRPIEKFLDWLDNVYAATINWTVRHRTITTVSLFIFFILTLVPVFMPESPIGTEFMPAQDNSRISATVELPIGTRVEITRATAEDLYALWREKYPEMAMINFSWVRQAVNVFGSMQNNGPHIISFNIRLSDLKEGKLVEILI